MRSTSGSKERAHEYSRATQTEDAKMKKPFVVDVRPVRSERLTPQEYLELQAEHPSLIERAEFIPPLPGLAGFGMFQVRYTRARHKLPNHGHATCQP